MSKPGLCIHGHFYQPPRENPWTGRLDEQPTAAPFHDWNERITEECYRANARARILAADGLPERTISNYALMSFDFGPTLLGYLASEQCDVYRAVLAADADGRTRFAGHGPAIAQSHSHAILPLANARDRRTEVRWGLRDFALRFGRESEGMWVPEAAIDTPTLETLAEEGVRFTIVAQRQAAQVRSLQGGEWRQVGGGGEVLDTRQAYRVCLPSGRSIAVFFYDGALSHEVAFGKALSDGAAFLRTLEGSDPFFERDVAGHIGGATKKGSDPIFDTSSSKKGPDPALVHLATDGETYGHHHAFAEMGLAWVLDHVGRGKSPLALTVYGQWLAEHPPVMEARLHERSSWSCIHGVERWRADCGCRGGRRSDGCQSWRGPLREALDDLRDVLAGIFEREGAEILADPWAARDAYIEVLTEAAPHSADDFLHRYSRFALSAGQHRRALDLLEMQRHALLMYASCAWFFDDLSDIEPLQAMAHAARAIELSGGSAPEVEKRFLAVLESVRGNDADSGDVLYRRVLEQRRPRTEAAPSV